MESQYFLELLIYMLKNIQYTTVSKKIFIMNLLTLVMKNEVQLSKLLHSDAFYILNDMHKNSQNGKSCPYFKLACIRQATAQIQHTEGLHWIVENNIWQLIFNCCYENQPQHITKAAYDFLSFFIYRLNELDNETNLIMVLEYIVRPILKSEYKNIQHLTAEIEATMIAELKPSIKTLQALFESEWIRKIGKTVSLLITSFIIEPHFYFFLEATRDVDFALLVCNTFFLLIYASVIDLRATQTEIQEEHAIEGVTYNNLIYKLVQKRMTSVVIDFAINTILIWSKFSESYKPTAFMRYGRTFNIDLQLIVIIIVPLLTYTNVVPFVKNEKYDDGLRNYTLKLSETTSEQLVKGCYMLRNVIEETDRGEILIMTLRKLTKLKGKLKNDQASNLFQALFYVLKKHVPTDESGSLVLTESAVKNNEDERSVTLVIENIKMLLTEHVINWYDSCEVICLYNITMNLLKSKALPRKVRLFQY